MEVTIRFIVLWDMTPCILVDRHQFSGETLLSLKLHGVTPQVTVFFAQKHTQYTQITFLLKLITTEYGAKISVNQVMTDFSRTQL
jgi:hypothetical protein